MRVCPLFLAPDLCPSESARHRPRRVGMRGLRHKPRHKIAAAPFRDVHKKNCEGGVVHSTPVLMCGAPGAYANRMGVATRQLRKDAGSRDCYSEVVAVLSLTFPTSVRGDDARIRGTGRRWRNWWVFQ
jgi:hypothetical protein